MESEDLFAQQDSEQFGIHTHEDVNIDKILEEDNLETDINTNKVDNINLDEHEILNDFDLEHNDNEDENEDNAESISKHTTANKSKPQEPKLIQLPLSKIRALMKLDPDMHLASTEAVFAVTKATELFIESLAKESFTFTAQSKKKTVQKRDVDLAIASIDSLMFLEGSMNF